MTFTAVYGRIYCITNAVNGKCYVGKTSLSIEKRWKTHCALAALSRRPTYLWKALLKYGPQQFAIKQLAIAYSHIHLDQLERAYIVSLGTLAPHGYNLQSGGEGGAQHHPDTRKKMVSSAKAACARPEVIAKKMKTRSTPEFIARISDAIRVGQSDPELRKKRSAMMRKAWNDPGYRKAQKERMLAPSYRLAISSAMKTLWADSEYRSRMCKKLKTARQNPIVRKRAAALRKAEWNVPGARERRMLSFAKPESKRRRSESSKAHWSEPGARERYAAAMRAGWAKRRQLAQ